MKIKQHLFVPFQKKKKVASFWYLTKYNQKKKSKITIYFNLITYDILKLNPTLF